MISKKEFIRIFDVASELDSSCVFVEVSAEGTEEIIVIPKKSFVNKKKFYESAYDENLVHVMNKDVKIFGYSHGGIADLANHIKGGDE